jgi:molybdenum storage protein
MAEAAESEDKRHHLASMLMRESLLDKEVQRSTDMPVFRMLPDTHVIKIGGRSILDEGRSATFPVVEALSTCLATHKLIIGTGGGVRSRHVFSIGIDLGMPTGVLAELAEADALGNAHILGTLLAPYGVVAIPPHIFGHLLPLFIRTPRRDLHGRPTPYASGSTPGGGTHPPHGQLRWRCFSWRNVSASESLRW